MRKHNENTLPKNTDIVEYLSYRVKYKNMPPEEIFNHKKIKKLTLCGLFPVAVLSAKLVQLTELEELRIERCGGLKLPKEIGRLKKLRVLEVIGGQVDTVPPTVIEIKSLRKLSLENCLDGEVPDFIFQMSELEDLVLRHNNLNLLPSKIGQLKKLRKLDLSLNKIEEIPNGLCELSELEDLSFRCNKIKILPEKIFDLKKLKNLSFHQNQLCQLPQGLGNLQELSALDLSDNKLTSLPNVFDSLRKLTSLKINKNEIKTCPNTIKNLPLKIFDWLNNPFGKLPLALFYLDEIVFHHIYNKRTYERLLSFVQECKNLELTSQQKVYLDWIYNSNWAQVSAIGKQELYRLSIIKNKNFRHLLLTAIVDVHLSDFKARKIDANSEVCILGKVALNKNEVKKRLKKLGVSYSVKLTKKVTHLVLGAGLKDFDAVAATNTIIISENSFLNYLNKVDTPYLLEKEESSELNIEHISTLLLSSDKDNVSLGLELLKGGGVPLDLLTELFIVYKLSGDKKLAAKARKMLQLNASRELQKVIKSRVSLLNADRYDVEKRLSLFTKDTELVVWKIVQYRIRTNPHIWEKLMRLAVVGVESCFVKDFAHQYLSSKQERNRLFFYNWMQGLVPYLYDMTELIALEVFHQIELPNGIAVLKNLKELRLEYASEIKRLPDDIGELNLSLLHLNLDYLDESNIQLEKVSRIASLKTLYLDGSVEKLPSALAKFKQIKNLHIKLSIDSPTDALRNQLTKTALATIGELTQLRKLELEGPFNSFTQGFYDRFDKLDTVRNVFYKKYDRL